MKSFLLITALFLTIGASAQKSTITNQERKFIKDYLMRTESDLLEIMASINDEQWTYKPANGGWSIAECMEHVIIAESAIWSGINKAMSAPAGNEDLSGNDAWLIGKINDRGNKVQTPVPPVDGKIAKTILIDKLKASRKQVYDYLENESLQLRNHYGKSPYGPADAYQLLIVMAAHSMRHTAQIQEVLSEINS